MLTPSGFHQPGRHKSKVDREHRQVRLLPADQQGCGEASDQTQHHARHAEAVGQHDGEPGDECQPCKCHRLSDQSVLRARKVERGIQRREPGPRQRLAHARIAQPVFLPVRDLGRAEQRDPEREGERHPNSGGQQPALDRPAHEEHARHGQRDPAEPDRQAASEQLLEIDVRAANAEAQAGHSQFVRLFGRHDPVIARDRRWTGRRGFVRLEWAAAQGDARYRHRFRLGRLLRFRLRRQAVADRRGLLIEAPFQRFDDARQFAHRPFGSGQPRMQPERHDHQDEYDQFDHGAPRAGVIVQMPPGVKSKPLVASPSHTACRQDFNAPPSVERMTKFAPMRPSRKKG